MRIILLFLFLICASLPIEAEILLRGELEYNVQSALNIVQDGVVRKINPIIFKPFLLDYNRNENLDALYNGVIELKDRELGLFSIGTYGIVYKKDPLRAYYYSNDGVLEFVDFRSAKDYPYKSYQYDVFGNLVNMGFRVSKSETFIYSPDGDLIAHWIGEKAYDENGEIIMTRKLMD